MKVVLFAIYHATLSAVHRIREILPNLDSTTQFLPPRDTWLEESLAAGTSAYLDRIHRWARIWLDSSAFIIFCVYIIISARTNLCFYAYAFIGLLLLFIIDSFYSPYNYRRLTAKTRRFLSQSTSETHHDQVLLRSSWLELNKCGIRYGIRGSFEVIGFAVINGLVIGWMFSWAYFPILVTAAFIASVIAVVAYLLYLDWAFYPLKTSLIEHGLIVDRDLIAKTHTTVRVKLSLLFGMASGSTLIFLATLGYTRAVALGAAPISFLLQLGGVVFVSTLLLTAFSMVLAQTLTMSIHDLDVAIAKVTEGDFSIQVPVVSADELGRICIGFNEMVRRLKQTRTQRKWFRRRLAQAQETEKDRIAREIHDSAMQKITVLQQRIEFLNMNLTDEVSVEELLCEAPDRLREINQELRNACSDLASDLVISKGLRRALLEWIDDLRRSRLEGVDLQLQISGNTPIQLPEETVLEVYRCIQQAIANALHHAQSDKIEIIMHCTPHMFEACVKDNGIGFEIERARSLQSEGHLGLESMYGRMELIGGELGIDTLPGRGTCIRIRVPLAEDA
jgi:signal transduction histidine kinase